MFSDKAVQAAEWTGAKAKKETWGRIKKSEGVKEYARETAEGEAEGPEEGVREVWRREKGIKKLKAAGTAVGKAHTWMRRRSLVRRGAARMMEATIREREEIEEEGERWHDRYEKSEDRVAAYRSRSQGPITKLEGRQRLVRLAGLGAKDLQKLKEEAPDLLERELRFAKNKDPKVYKEAGLAVPDLLDAGKDWEQEFEEQGMEEAESLGQRFERLGSNMREALVPEGEEDDLVQELKEMKNIQRANLSKERYDQKMDELISVVAMQKSVKKLRPHEVEDQARTVLENDLFQEAVARYGRPGVAKKIAEEGIDLNQTINDELGGEQLVETNQTLARLITHSPNYQALFDVEGLEGKTDYKVLARLKGHPVVKEYYKNLKEIQRTRSGIEEMEGENKIMSGLKEQAEEKGEDDKVTQYENSIAWNQRWIATLEKANKQVKKETSRVRHRFNQEQEKVWNEVQDLLERRGPKGVEGERRPKEEREEEGPEIIVASPRGRPADWDTKQKILEDAKKVLEESGGQEGGAPPTPTPSPPQGPPPSQGPSSSGFDATEYNNKRDKLESLVRGLSPFHLPENVKRAQQLVEEIKDLHDEYPSLKREDPVLERWSPFPELEKTVEKEVKLLEGRES